MAQKALGASERLTLLDADVLIDFQRGVQASKEWMLSLTTEEAFVTGCVALEMVVGSRSRRELDRSIQLLDKLAVLWHTEQEGKLAWDLARSHSLSSGLSLPDYLIAAQAIERQAKLYTFNAKHFRDIPGLKAEAPYLR